MNHRAADAAGARGDAAMTTTGAMLDAALEHAARGEPVFPVWWAEGPRCGCPAGDCERPAKHPLASCAPRGLLDATTDAATIRAWWTQFPRANIGGRTGTVRVVLDVDPRAGGRESLARLEAQHGPMPATPRTRTGGGGDHYSFAPVRGLRNSAGNLAPGLDIRAEGGYVLLPPSSHVSGGVYADDPDAALTEHSLAPMPPWLIALARATSTGHGANGGEHRAPDAWAEKLTGAPEGQRRAVALEIAGHYLGLLGPARESEVAGILCSYARACAPPFPEGEARALVRDLARRDRVKPPAPAGLADDGAWPIPEPVAPALVEVPAFDVERLLPAAFVPWARDVAERAQCPADFVAIAVMVAAGAVVGRQLTIRPKRHDDWAVVANVWGLAVGRPGVMKTAAMEEGLRGVRRLMAEAAEAYQRAQADHAFGIAKAKAARAAVDKRLKTAADKNEDLAALRADFDATQEPAVPTERRYLVNDSTVEKLGELLNQNTNGLLLFRDELVGFLRTLEREGHQNDQSFYCEAWDGDKSYRYDRIGRGTLHIGARACPSSAGFSRAR